MSNLFYGSSFEEYKEYLEEIEATNQKVECATSKLLRNDKNIDSVMQDYSLTEREFIEIIASCRQVNYNRAIGGANKAAENETDRLYAKNPWKFVEEFLQNADDCNYTGVPEIDITIDERNEKHPFIEFSYNEEGFERSDIWAITAFSESTKINDTVKRQEESGIFYKEKTGRKGKGFKAVFSLNAENVIVHIRSNGFSFKLDNKIGRIMPVWEEDPDKMDGKTHVIVELIRPQFSVVDIYPEFRRLFCVDNTESIFVNSPFLFMHRMRSVHITKIGKSGIEEFLTEYKENLDRTIYGKPFDIDKNKVMLAGIADHGTYYKEQFQEGCISTYADDNLVEIPVVRYTKMVEDEENYRNYSIMAPILTKDSVVGWRRGSLFRTFPMSLHPLNMPIAIDAPFILNPDRSGVQYSSYKDEDGRSITASEWNTEVTNRLFEEDGVFETFMLKLRAIENIRLDKYIRSEDIMLFEDRNNSDGHGNNWVPIVNLSEIAHRLPLFRLFADSKGYVNFNDAVIVNKDLFNWPCVNTLFSLMLGQNYEQRILSDIYVGTPLFKARPIVKEGFVNAMNEYLDKVDDQLGVESEESIYFVNNYLYPYLRDNYALISKTETDAFKKLSIYYSRLQVGNEIHTIRESYSDRKIKWFHSKRESLTSINRYRIFESSPVNMEIIKQIVKDIFHEPELSAYFADNNINKTSKNCKTWNDVKDMIEAVYHFGFSTKVLYFPCLVKYVLSENLDSEFNAFRMTEVASVIDDEDIYSLAEYIGDIDQTISDLKRMGLKNSRDYFEENGNYIGFRADTLDVLKSPDCPDKILEDLCVVKKLLKKDVNATYEMIGQCREDIVLFFLNEDKALFSTDSYAEICDAVQCNDEYWKKTDLDATEVLIRACAGATKPLPEKEKRKLSIRIDYVLSRHLEYCITKIVGKNKIGKLSVDGDSSFSVIPKEEIQPLIALLKPDDVTDQAIYFKGNLAAYGNKMTYIKDGKGGHVYLQCDAEGNYKPALEDCLKKSFDTETLKIIDEMELQYHEVKEKIIVPMFNQTGHDLGQTYDEVERRFSLYSKKQIISILSWFRYSGYTNALGNGNINNEKEIEDDYRNDPWKFIYEFIQNVDDCSFEKRNPFLNITIDQEQNRIVFVYNENGFTLDDVKSLTKFGDSNKQGQIEEQALGNGIFDKEKTGRKGRGFKSVFALPGKGIVVHVCSNGFAFKFVKRLGSIIPIWEDIEDAPEIGTRIIVEGFDTDCTQKLMADIGDMFGINDMSSFGSVCPILYLRKLNTVSIQNGNEAYSVDIETIEKTFSENIYQAIRTPVAGIACNGTYRESLWEKLHITISSERQKLAFEGARYSTMFSMGNAAQVISVFAPVIYENTEIYFNKGALYRTLPLDEHELSIPLSINAPFYTNSGRSAVEDNEKNNKIVIDAIREKALPGFFENIRSIPRIDITAYIPNKKDPLFAKYKNITEVDLQELIKSLPILRSYSREDYVSCKDAKVLPSECYDWVKPDILANCFDSGKNVLVEACYANLHIARYRINFITTNFVKNLNSYLADIDLADEQYIALLQEYIYPYINDNYDLIVRKYREADRQKDLQKLQIYAFELFDGRIVRESADASLIWMDGVPDGLYSFGKYRSVSTGSLKDPLTRYKWLQQQHTIINFRDAFTSSRLQKKKIEDWNQAAELIETILYYNVEREVNIPFLRDCALSVEFDDEDNVFRTGYIETENTDVLKHLITEEDLRAIITATGVFETRDLQSLAQTIKSMGLRAADDFFEDNGRDIYALNRSTIALLKSYCYEKTTTETILKVIDSAFKKMKKQKSSSIQFHISYKDIKDCHESVFAKIFEYEILSGDIERNLAVDFCQKAEVHDNPDYAEAFLRALNLSNGISEERNLELKLSEINERTLGSYVQNGKLGNMDKLHLKIIIDIQVDDYQSEEADKALKWLDDDDAVSVSYEYYTADLSAAFGAIKDGQVGFIFDDTKVILNKSAASNSMLKFVQRRYKGKDGSFSNLVSIISEQNELKSIWRGTKKEYIIKLSKYREDTWKQREVLVPDYDTHINDANGKAIDYVLSELLQNINDCALEKSQQTRTLNVEINENAGTMLLQYDEAGFDYANVYSITAIGQSSKHDASEGEKGLGFKKVFTLFKSVEIYSNGFCFSLTSEKNTVPKWIDDKEKTKKYMIEGKTTMLFQTSSQRRSKLADIKQQWIDLMNGKYVGNQVSPLFLEHIDSIYVSGYKRHYSREIMLQDFIFMKVPVLSYYKKILDESEVNDAYDEYLKAREELKLRRKCKTMTNIETNQYVDSLTFEICIPRNISEATKGKGCFYSTLPTESQTYSTVFMNVPLELTTGRDGIVDSSDYNIAIRRILFTPCQKKCSTIFVRMLESIANENRNIFMINYFGQNFEKFFEILAGNKDNLSCIRKGFENAKLFEAYRMEKMVSIWDSYSIDKILCQYVREVPDTDRKNDIDDWMRKHCGDTENLSLILPKEKDCDTLERFATAVNSVNGEYYPVQLEDKDIVIEYLKEEYGYVGGICCE